MEHLAALPESDGWLWITQHPAVVVAILIASAVPTAMATWCVLQTRYRATIRSQRRALREFAEKLGGATAGETQRRLRFLQSRLDRLEPRHLSGHAQSVLKTHLPLPEAAGNTHINVAYDASCGDGKRYAEEFARVLRSCRGWRSSSGTVFGWGRETPSGLAIVCFGHGRTAVAGKFLSRALTEAGIDHETIQSPEEELELVITRRHSVAEQPAH